VAALGDAEDELLRIARDLHADDHVPRVQLHAAHAVRDPPHRPHVGLLEADALAFAGGEEDLALAVAELGLDQLVALVHAHGDDAPGPRVREVAHHALLDGASAGDHDDELVLALEILDRQHGAHFLALLQRDQTVHRFALAGRAGVGNLVDLEPVDAAGVGEHQDVAVGRGDEQVLDEILVARPRALAPAPAPALGAVGRDRRALQITGVGDGDGDRLLLDQILEHDFRGSVLNLRAARVFVAAEVLADILQFVGDHAAQLLVAGQNRLELRDAELDLGQLVEDLLPLQPGEAVQLQVEDRLRLLFAERELLHQPLARLLRAGGGADELDDRVEVVQGDPVPLQNMLALARLAQLEGRAPADHVHPVVEKALDGLDQAHLARLAVGHRQQDHAEAGLQVGVLVQLVEDQLGLLAALQLQHDAHAVAVALVADVADALDPLLLHQLGDAFDQPGLVDL